MIDATEALLDVAKESSDRFPHLKSCLGGINALVKHYITISDFSWARLTDFSQQSKDVNDKLEELIPCLTKLGKGLAKADANVSRRLRGSRNWQG